MRRVIRLSARSYAFGKNSSITKSNKYSFYDRAWSVGISQFGNLRFFEDGFGTPSELELLKKKIELCKSLDPSVFVLQCKKTIQITSYGLIIF